MAVLLFIQSIMSTPAIFVGLIAMLGLLLQKSDLQTVIKGTIMTILGFIVLNAGAPWYRKPLFPSEISSRWPSAWKASSPTTKQSFPWA